jgi:hypothetical protein
MWVVPTAARSFRSGPPIQVAALTRVDMSEIKSIREILEELAAGDDRLRESFPKWLAERDRQKLPPKKGPASEAPPAEDQTREGNS